jgi:hypothetical protein
MGASFHPATPTNDLGRLYDILFSEQDRPSPMLTPATEPLQPEYAVLRLAGPKPNLLPEGFAFQLAQDRADIDISGPEFNFVRSIRVYDVRYARQHESGRDGDCNRSATIYLGTYGTQGDFSWTREVLRRGWMIEAPPGFPANLLEQHRDQGRKGPPEPHPL